MKKENILQWNKRIFSKSFGQIDLNIIWMIFLDSIFYLSSWLLYSFWELRIQQKLDSLNLPSPEEVISLGEKAELVAQSSRDFYILQVSSFILVVLAIVLIASIIKFLIWAKVTRTRYSLHLFSKFLTLNLIWTAIWSILIFSAAKFAQLSYVRTFIIALTILGVYFTSITYPIFMHQKKIKVIGKSIYMAISKIRFFMIPFAIFLFLTFWTIRIGVNINFRFAGYLYTLLLLVVLAYYRYYTSAMVQDLEHAENK